MLACHSDQEIIGLFAVFPRRLSSSTIASASETSKPIFLIQYRVFEHSKWVGALRSSQLRESSFGYSGCEGDRTNGSVLPNLFDRQYERSWGHIMKFARRRFLRLAAGAAVVPALAPFAEAQAYPAHPIRLIVGYTPGGSADLTARLMGQWLSERLGQSFVIENRPGGGTNIATEAALRSPPDGYTLLLAAPANAINATLYDKDKLNFNFLRDTEPVAGIIRFPNVVVVNPSVPVKSIPELIAYAKANPGKLNMASSGNGSTIHMSGELFKMLTGINMVHVPYRGGAPALTDLIAGQVHVMFDNIPTCAEHVKSGKLRGLAVTSTTRSDVLPDLPTVADFLPGYEASAWYGFSAPKNTPGDVIHRLNKETNAILADPAAKKRFAELGAFLLPGSAAEFGKLLADETEKWGKVVKFAGARVD
jgi:tripartite-type tricarboxylate transporter receptor subunit TctC